MPFIYNDLRHFYSLKSPDFYRIDLAKILISLGITNELITFNLELRKITLIWPLPP